MKNFAISFPFPWINCTKPWTNETMSLLHFRAYSLHSMPQLHFYYFPVTPRALLLHFFHHYSGHDLVPLLRCQPFSLAPVALANVSERPHTHPVDLSPFTNCTVVRFSIVPFWVDGGDLCTNSGDLCEPDEGKLTTTRSWKPQLPPRFSRASHTAKTVFSFLHPC